MERVCDWIQKRTKDRNACGWAASMIGIGANALLCGAKVAVGAACGSVAMMADGLNNLSDASSGVVSLVGFRLAQKPADAEHPYGHGRYEYLAGLTVAVMVTAIGVNLLMTSAGRIITPEMTRLSTAGAAVLIAAILVKLAMMRFYDCMGRKIGSGTLRAAAQDSRNDCLTSGAVLLAGMMEKICGWKLDGIAGAGVAIFIIISGVMLIRDTVDPMLGSAPDKEKMEEIRRRILAVPGVLGVHDLIVHDYGPGRQYASVHVEMDAQASQMENHEILDRIERDFRENDGLALVAHCDPVEPGDALGCALREMLSKEAEKMEGVSIHDVRIRREYGKTRVTLDCVAPYGADEVEIRGRLTEAVKVKYGTVEVDVTVEHGFEG